jgi:hypothetical protein
MQSITINHLNDLLSRGCKLQAIVEDFAMPKVDQARITELSGDTQSYFKRMAEDHNLQIVKVNVYKPNGSSTKLSGTYFIKDENFLVPKNELQQTATAMQQTATDTQQATTNNVATTLQHNGNKQQQQQNNHLQGVAEHMQQNATTILPILPLKPTTMNNNDARVDVLEFKLNYTTDLNETLKKRVRELELLNENVMQENLKLMRTSTLADDRHAFELEKQANELRAESKSGLAGVGDLLSNNKEVIMELAGMAKDVFIQSRATPAIAGVTENLHENTDAHEAIRAINQQFKTQAPESVGKLYMVNEYLIKHPHHLEASFQLAINSNKPKPTAV